MVQVTVKSASKKGYNGITQLLLNERKELSFSEKMFSKQMFSKTVLDDGTTISVTYVVKNPMLARYLTSDTMLKPIVEALQTENLIEHIDYEIAR